MISFTAERNYGTSFLHWITENEQNVSHFEIQRSDNASAFATIGTVAARNIIFQQHYDFEDPFSFHGIAYYRLKSIDYDGKSSYSKIVAVTEKELQSSSFIVLNPVHDAVTVFNKTGEDGLFDYELYNAAGQLVLKGNITMTSNGGAALPLPVQTAAGIYLFKLSNEKIMFRKELLIRK
jgi:hypothetical protein